MNLNPRVIFVIALVALCVGCVFALSNSDLIFLTDKEQFQILQKHQESILQKAKQGDTDDLKAALYYAERADLPDLALECHYKLATQNSSLEDALQWLLLMQSSEADSSAIYAGIDDLLKVFADPQDQLLLLQYSYGGLETELQIAVDNATRYNSVIEASAKELVDEISTTKQDSLALKLIEDFYKVYPKSQYCHIALYYSLYHLSSQKNWNELLLRIEMIDSQDPVQCYVASLYLLSPTLRRSLGSGFPALDKADALLQKAKSEKPISLLHEQYSPSDWQARVTLQQAKSSYYRLLEAKGLWGDEEKPALKVAAKPYKQLLKKLDRLDFSNNNRGEQAEIRFWQAKALMLMPKASYQLKAAKCLVDCLVMGAPRMKYDAEALKLISAIHEKQKIKLSLMDWMRSLKNYKGVEFVDLSQKAGLEGKNYSRVALGDYNNDGLIDILFSGKYLYRNEGNWSFSEVSQESGLAELSSAGGLFADFNKDGRLDLLSYGHAEDGSGDLLLKNMDNTRFARVNERAGDIDDRSPTEAAAWIDINSTGYPSLYMANYEKWQVQSGFPDYFWENEEGYFSDQSSQRGFLNPSYTHNPGLAGRGVAPADFDNDGSPEIFVTNYRLNRNFCWKRVDSLYVDIASLYGLTGIYKKGYYGHSIGADWGDIDNDGDLDLFIANLAHPRFLDISDTSILLRNDGLGSRIVEQDTLYFWQFTDITGQAGISYDELHSDPLFFDADNDGFLDLFISSVYVNERSYLYRNRGDGSFEDITWLSGARIYNGWGSAAGDLDRDGLQDMVIGSGSGAKVLRNITKTHNKSLVVKPVWEKNTVLLETNPALFDKLHNSPAFGTRIIVRVRNRNGKTVQLSRELNSAKGTGSQSAQELHFGLGDGEVIEIRKFAP